MIEETGLRKPLDDALAIEADRLQKARVSLWDFTRYTFPTFIPNWHHYKICEYLMLVFLCQIDKLMIFMPPRHGKSELATIRFPSFCLGKNPNEQIIQCSYGSDLANKMNRGTQRVIESHRYQSVFPNTMLPGMSGAPTERNAVRTSEYFDISGSDNLGYYRSAGVGGGITGMGFTLGIIDDPYKDRQEADSEVHRARVWDWYWSTFITRMERKARQLLILTRWHDMDLAGRLLKEDEGWKVLCLPALKEDEPNEDDPRQPGQPLWPYKRDKQSLIALRRRSSRDWASLWQQDPVVSGGNIIKSHWWKYYHELPKGDFHKQIIVVDCAFKDTDDSDYVVVQAWGRLNTDKYLLDQFRDKLDIIETVKAIKRMVAKWPDTLQIWIEDKANGPAVIQMLQSKITGVKAFEPKGSKESRVVAVADQIEGGNVHLPHPKRAPWIGDYVDEHTRFPKAANDDQVDGTSMALNILAKDERSSWFRLATS